MEMTPQQIVSELDRYIIGQNQAKRAVAIALRNRYRWKLLASDMRDEVVPKNILMIGPTGVGKTEIARRLAKLANAPFIKVEATKFTEVGYVGRDVESIIRDLLESAIRMLKAEKMQMVEDKAKLAAEERLLDIFVPLPEKDKHSNPFGAMFGMNQTTNPEDDQAWNESTEKTKTRRDQYRMRLMNKELESELIEIEIEDQNSPFLDVLSGAGMEDMSINIQDMLGGLIPKRKRKRKTTVEEARKILLHEEASKLLDMDTITAQAIERCEEAGIVFIDEIDKVAGKEGASGIDVSREGVQRDILPIVEGSTVITKYGSIRTDYILFIAAGAFHVAKPSDLIPELQGRFPIRVELSSLTKDDFQKILTEPKNALLKQYRALLQTEGVDIEFSHDGIAAIAGLAAHVNDTTENIGARRLHTILERLLEDVSFAANEITEKVCVDANYVHTKLSAISTNKDLSSFIL